MEGKEGKRGRKSEKRLKEKAKRGFVNEEGKVEKMEGREEKMRRRIEGKILKRRR